MKVYLSKRGFCSREIVLPQMYICLRGAFLIQIRGKTWPLFFLFRVTHQTACLYILHSQTLLMNFICNHYSQIEVWLIYKIMFDNSLTKQMHRTWRDTENILKFKPIMEFLHNQGHSECCSFL